MFHDDEACISIRVARRENEILAHGTGAAGFVEEELTKVVFLLPEVHHLVVHGLPRDVQNSSNDDVTSLAGGMDTDNVERTGERHVEKGFRSG